MIVILVFHQTGFRYQWNIRSYLEDGAGDGLILSPLNIPSSQIINLDKEIKKNSYFDPQLYIFFIKNANNINTYSYFPCNLKGNYNHSDLDLNNKKTAKKCIDFQLKNDFRYIIIPTLYFDNIVTNYFTKIGKFIIQYIDYFKSVNVQKKLLLTLFVKQEQLSDESKMIDLLNWATKINEVDGFYVIFENKFTTKQIKNINYLVNTLKLISALKFNGFEVHIGYNNNEGILYSIASPNSISLGSFENLRKFDIRRFQSNKTKSRNPNPRIYSSKLFQWIEKVYIDKIIFTKSNIFKDIFYNTRYKIKMFNPNYTLHFAKPDIYMHYFIVFSKQLKNIASLYQRERIAFLESNINDAKKIFNQIENLGIDLDENSDGSHLDIWIKAIEKFKSTLE